MHECGPRPLLDLVEVYRGHLAGLLCVRRGERQRKARREDREDGRDARSHRFAASLAERAPPGGEMRPRGGCPIASGVVPCEGS